MHQAQASDLPRYASKLGGCSRARLQSRQSASCGRDGARSPAQRVGDAASARSPAGQPFGRPRHAREDENGDRRRARSRGTRSKFIGARCPADSVIRDPMGTFDCRLYGSEARNEARSDSDTDVCLVLGLEVDSGRTGSQVYLDYIGYPGLDVRVFQRFPLYVRQRVLKDGKVLFASPGLGSAALAARARRSVQSHCGCLRWCRADSSSTSYGFVSKSGMGSFRCRADQGRRVESECARPHAPQRRVVSCPR